jgi:hypothetical protein
MIKTQKLYAGDLVADHYGNDIRVGMITHFDEAFIRYKIEWCGHQSPTSASWITVQEYRNIYLAWRRGMK